MENKMLNIIKCIAAFGVICIHFPFPSIFGGIVECTIGRTGVVIFFIIAGYYNSCADKKKIITKIRKTIALLIILQFIYLLFNQTINPQTVTNIINKESIIKLLLFNEPISGYHLWFLCSLLYCYISLLILNKLNHYKIIYALVPILLIIFLLSRHLLAYINNNVFLVRNFWFLGFPFFYIGHYIKNHVEALIKVKYKTLMILSILSIVVILYERYMFTPMSFYFGTIILSACIFIFSLKHPTIPKNKILNCIQDIGKNYYDSIYYWHILLGTLITIALPNTWFLCWINPIAVMVFVSLSVKFVMKST